jgi:hypothetical protein
MPDGALRTRPARPIVNHPHEDTSVTAKILMLVSAGISLLLGILHLVYTFSSSHLLPRDPALRAAMEAAPLAITRETSVLRAWIGFNASHGIALLLFGLVFGVLAVSHSRVLFGSNGLLAIGFATLLGFAVLARLYWFSVPLAAVTVALLAYVASVVAARV